MISKLVPTWQQGKTSSERITSVTETECNDEHCDISEHALKTFTIAAVIFPSF